MSAGRPGVVRRLVGVYDADHTLRGELRYWVGARLGQAHCALCEISHGLVRAKPAWHAYRSGLPVPFDTYHRDDQPETTRDLGLVPVVAAETDGGVVVLLNGDALDRCDGSVERLGAAIRSAMAAQDLRWPDGGPGRAPRTVP